MTRETFPTHCVAPPLRAPIRVSERSERIRIRPGPRPRERQRARATATRTPPAGGITNLTLTTRPDAVTLDRSYDPAGRLDLLTMPTRSLDYTYYPAGCSTTGCAPGRLASIVGPSGVTLGYTYDGPSSRSLAKETSAECWKLKTSLTSWESYGIWSTSRTAATLSNGSSSSSSNTTSDAGFNPERISRLCSRVQAGWQATLQLCSRRGRPARQPTQDDEVALLRALLAVATAVLARVNLKRPALREYPF